MKSRGMGHSNQVREFIISSHGIDLLPVAVGPDGVLTGSARLNLESTQRADALSLRLELERRARQIERKRRALDAQIETMRGAYAAEEEEERALIQERTTRAAKLLELSERSSRQRSAPRAERKRS